MGFDDFIGLDTSCDDNNANGDSDLHMEPNLEESKCHNITDNLLEDVARSDNVETFAKSKEGDDPDEQDMDLEDDSDPQKVVPGEKTQLETTGTAVETVKITEIMKAKNTFEASEMGNGTASYHLLNESSILGVKRSQTMYDDKQPSVRVVYNSLTRESKRKLTQLMQQWSEWEAKSHLSSQKSKEDALEDGEETYFPALCVGSRKSSSVSFWIDNQAMKETVKDHTEFDPVPLYDRGCKLGSNSVDGGANNDEGTEYLDDSRCFNCQSYGHSLKDCPMPRDNAKINSARKMHNSKRSQSSNNREQARYYKKTPGKFDDLRPGVLGPETRESLGMKEHDPPPWLHRMREMGYPPGYLDVDDEDQPSGITIYAEEETEEEYEDGELPERTEPVPPKRKMTVEFPGINAPIPADADPWLWGSSSTGLSSSNSYKRHATNLYFSSEPPRVDHHRRTSSQRHEEHGPGHEPSSYPGYSPRYRPYDDHRMRSRPNQGRSLSDRGRNSMDHETSHNSHSPYFHSVDRSPSYERWNPDDSYDTPPPSSFERGRERNEHRHSHSYYRR